MAELFPNKYNTPFRIVTGTPQLFPNDVVLLCDTSLAPVVLDMLEIPDNFWSTQWSLYIVDLSNNASVNNITINAGVGQVINGLATMVINTDHPQAYTKIVIGGNKSFLSQNSTSGGSFPFFFIVTNAQLLALITASTIVEGAFYYVTDPIQWSYGGIGVVVQGVRTNGVSVEGTGIYFNADYQKVGNYSGIAGFGANLGIWGTTPIAVVPNDVAIWNNQHYQNLTGVWYNGVDTPDADAINWKLLAPKTPNGYIQECDFIKYNAQSNEVIYRADQRQNEVYFFIDGKGNNNLVAFQWGRNNCNQNKLSGESSWEATNSNCTITGNELYNGILADATQQLAVNTGIIVRNIINSTGQLLLGETYGVVANNVITTGGALNITGVLPTLSIVRNNIIELNSILSFANIQGTCNIYKNKVTQQSMLENTSILDETNIIQCFTSNGSIFTIGPNPIGLLFAITGCEVSDFNKVDLTTITQNYTNYKIRKGFSNWEWDLSLADYLAGQLTIPLTKNYAGIYTCTGLGGFVVDSLLNLSYNHNAKFKASNLNVVSFAQTLIGVAVPNNLVSASLGVSNLIGRTDGFDFIEVEMSAKLVQTTKIIINA